MFETVGALMRSVCTGPQRADAVLQFEAMLFPPFQVRGAAPRGWEGERDGRTDSSPSLPPSLRGVMRRPHSTAAAAPPPRRSSS